MVQSDLLEQCQEVLPHHPTRCRGCGAALTGDDPEPLRHQVVEIPAIVPFVIEHQLHRLSCPCCRTVTAAVLPVGVERGGYGPRLSSLVGLLDQVLFIPISTGAINAIRCRLSDSLAALVEEAAAAIRREKLAHIDETGGPMGNAVGNNPDGRRGWLWVMVTPVLTVFKQVLRPLGGGGPPTTRRQLRRDCGLRSLQRLQLAAAGAGEPVVPSVASLARRRDRQARTAIPHGADPPGL